MRVVPELGGDEELGAWDVALGDCAADGWLGAVDMGGVNVPILQIWSDNGLGWSR